MRSARRRFAARLTRSLKHQLLLPNLNARVAASHFDLTSKTPLDARQRVADIDHTLPFGFQTRALFEIGFTAVSQLLACQTAEVVRSRILGSAVDYLSQYLIGTNEIVGEVAMNTFAI